MKRIAVGGQIDKEKISDIVKKIGGDEVSVSIKTDLEAAMSVKNGDADLYLGACNTGGGGALAMAIAVLGMNNCANVSMSGSLKSKEDVEEEIKKEVSSGKKAFGFTAQDMDKVVPAIVSELLKE